jgi:predicted ATPase
MQLLFLWINNNLVFNNISFNFSNKYIIDVNKESSSSVSIIIDNNKQYINDFFGNNINNIAAIIGENGTGKSLLMEYLTDSLTNEYIVGDKFIIGFIDSEYRIKIYHTLYEFTKEDWSIIYNDWEIKIINPSNTDFNIELIKLETRVYNIHGNLKVDEIPNLSDTVTIYYSPIVDFRNYPPNFDNPKHFDISTNFLFSSDSKNTGFDSIDIVEVHKLQNTKRQLEYLTSGLLGHSKEISIPKNAVIFFLSPGLSQAESRNLSYENQQIQETISNLANKYFHDLEQNEENFNLENGKRWFIYNFIQNLFYNLSYYKDYEKNKLELGKEWLKINIKEYPEPFAIVKKLLSDQKWINPDAALALIEFINSIETESNVEYVSTNRDNSLALSMKDTQKLLIYYMQYLESLPNENKTGFISFEWRNLSSGEKLQLDLFSRLFSVKGKILEQKGKGQVSKVFLLLDEGEVGMHPLWQRRYVKSLIDFLGLWSFGGCFAESISMQIILTSHSPFIISDLPRECITLLSKIHDSVSIIKRKPDEEDTFGANIHELLANSFFLGGSLIGDFADEKINQLIKIVSADDKIDGSSVAEIGNLIELIAEPIIRNKIREMFITKLLVDGNDDVLSVEEKRLVDLLTRIRKNRI